VAGKKLQENLRGSLLYMEDEGEKGPGAFRAKSSKPGAWKGAQQEKRGPDSVKKGVELERKSIEQRAARTRCELKKGGLESLPP